MKKIAVIVVVLGIVGAVGWQVQVRIAASKKEASRGRGPGAMAVEVTPVTRRDMRDIGVFTGSLQPKSQFVVAPKVSGRLRKLLVNVGDPVRRGQLIAALDDAEYAQQYEQAKAELEVAKANVADCLSALDVAKREFERMTALRAKQIASESELDAAEARYKASEAKHRVALAQVTQKEASTKASQIRLSYAEVHADWESGTELRVVGERFVDEGSLLKENDPVVSVLEEDVMTAVIHVIERDYPKVSVGQAVAVSTDAYPDESFPGKIARIAPLLKETSRQGRVEVEIANPDRKLKAGMYVRARIEFLRHDGATVVPRETLVKRDDRQGVFLAEGGRARFVPVTLGIVQGEMVEVTDPPLEGQVVSLGQQLLEDGGKIVLPGDDQAGRGGKPRPASAPSAASTGSPAPAPVTGPGGSK